MVNLMVKCQKSTNIQMQTNTQTQSQDLAVEIPIGPSSGQIEMANLPTSYSECDLLNPLVPESPAPSDSSMNEKIYI